MQLLEVAAIALSNTNIGWLAGWLMAGLRL